jgi:hypothetical protein
MASFVVFLSSASLGFVGYKKMKVSRIIREIWNGLILRLVPGAVYMQMTPRWRYGEGRMVVDQLVVTPNVTE